MTPIKTYLKCVAALLFCLMFLTGAGGFIGACVTPRRGSRDVKVIGLVLMGAALLGIWGIEKDD